jgi:hypothetical protein
MEEWKGILASDSKDAETDRYSYEMRPVKSKRKFAKITVKQLSDMACHSSYN